MLKLLPKYLFICCLALFGAISIFAQSDASSASGKPSENIKPEGFWENLAKKRIAEEKKDYEKLIRRTEEINQISEEIGNKIEVQAKLNSDDLAKVNLLEKTVKKVREDLGAKDDEKDESAEDSKPLTLKTAVESLKENSQKLVSSIKKSTRYTISVLAIQSSNNVLRAVRFVKSQVK